ncbi:MAG: hypothetical protein SP4CHLAM5_07400 [Chlamydiia bacterium]|nr:hypothetical protein [Chlamydiia bacterium]MCH9618607.1 hypothetical protein [Chlamydiia bacterium]MCH9624327.1 hypothetical protein [Chlamydiia bacterium]
MAQSTSPPSGDIHKFVKYAIPPIAGALAIIPAFHNMRVKSAQQLGGLGGVDLKTINRWDSLKMGLRAAPTVGAIVGAQMITQEAIESNLFPKESLYSTLTSSAMVGVVSSPLLAFFNHQTLGSGRPFIFTPRVALALTVQETAFVTGLSVVDKVTEELSGRFGDNKVVDYVTAYIAGGIGSIVGHPANTALTRWQGNLPVERFSQLTRGLAAKTKATATFALGYKVIKDLSHFACETPFITGKEC